MSRVNVGGPRFSQEKADNRIGRGQACLLNKGPVVAKPANGDQSGAPVAVVSGIARDVQTFWIRDAIKVKRSLVG
ncbi:MAG: hypothetical protein ACU0A2_05655 [Cognatishimia sp.]|uniref:hypothetical protein n=1 Tax=Cognatishimia sp. TaxID=2211648 RepID=UPI004059F526